MTWFVTRREDGSIAAAYQYRQHDLQLEELADDNGELVAFLSPPAPVPASITRRQCAMQMFASSLISADEALSMTRDGTPPAMVAAMFAQMPPDQSVMAQIDFAADTYSRANPLLVTLMQSTGANDTAMDDFFRAAAVL